MRAKDWWRLLVAVPSVLTASCGGDLPDEAEAEQVEDQEDGEDHEDEE